MADRFEDFLFAAADQANAGVDYDAMRECILKKQNAKKLAFRSNVIRYGAVAAAAIVLVAAGATLLSGGFSDKAATESAPEAQNGACYSMDSFALVPDEGGDEEDETFTASGLTQAPAPDATNETSSARGAGEEEASMNAAEAPSIMQPELPDLCGSVCEGLFWDEAELELPFIEFGGQQSVEADAERFICTVEGCTAESFSAYVMRLDEWFPAQDGADAGTDTTASPFERVTADGYTIRLTLEEGTMTLTVEK